MASSLPAYRTGFTASMDGVSNAGVFIPMDSQTKIEDGASLGVKSYNITANTANSNENTVLSNIQVLEYEEVSRVDYNKKLGNWIKIYYDGKDDNSDNYSIMDISDDFSLNGSSAKYIFVFEDGRTQEMIVGQTYEDYGFTDAPFIGQWIGTNAGPNSSVVKPFNSSHTVSVQYNGDEGYYIFSSWK